MVTEEVEAQRSMKRKEQKESKKINKIIVKINSQQQMKDNEIL